MSIRTTDITRRYVLWTLILCSIVAFAARAGVIVYLKAWRTPNAMEHKSIALSLVSGSGFSFGDWGYYGPSSVQSPPFPFLLASMYKVFGTETPPDGSLHGANAAYLAIMLLNALAGAALVWLTYLMARTLGSTALAGLIAAAAVAIWPSQIYSARAVQAISLITCSVAAMVILFYRALRTGRLGPAVGYSIIAAVATLTEPVLLPAFTISVLLVLAWRDVPKSTRQRFAFVIAMTAFIIIGPWTLRNRIVHEKWVPIKDTFWVNMWKGNNEFATGSDRLALSDSVKTKARDMLSKGIDDVPDGDHQYDMLDLSQQSRLHNQPEVIRETVFKEYATDWISHNPGRYFRLCGIRFAKTLTIDWDNPKSYNTVYVVSRFILLALTLAGLFVIFRQGWSLLFPALLAGAALVTYTLTVTAARFSMPFEPLQLCIGAAFIASVIERFTHCQTTHAGFASAEQIEATRAKSAAIRTPPKPSRAADAVAHSR